MQICTIAKNLQTRFKVYHIQFSKIAQRLLKVCQKGKDLANLVTLPKSRNILGALPSSSGFKKVSKIGAQNRLRKKSSFISLSLSLSLTLPLSFPYLNLKHLASLIQCDQITANCPNLTNNLEGKYHLMADLLFDWVGFNQTFKHASYST